MTIKRKYTGGVISATSPSINAGAASGMWNHIDVVRGMTSGIWPGQGYTINYLIVAGGGSGGAGNLYFNDAGGGGAGGLLTGSITLNKYMVYSVIIGGGAASAYEGIQGSNSSLSGSGYNGSYNTPLSIVAYGGGGGVISATSQANGGSGGGGGAVYNAGSWVGGSGVYPGSSYISAPRQGYDGGRGNGNPVGGGGGGAGGPGAAGPGVGGIGLYSSITGSTVGYAGGGAGYGAAQGLAANFGGGANGVNGTPGTGGGGGGSNGNYVGGAGGGGVFILSYQSQSQLGTGGSVSTYGSGANKFYVHTFYGSATYTA